MGYTEIKNRRIEDLQRRVNEVGKEVKTAQAKVTAATNTLKNRTDVYNQDKANKDTAKQNLELLEKAQNSCTTSTRAISSASKSSDTLHSDTLKMVEQTYETAQKVITAATRVSELVNYIDKVKLKNKLISDLLVQDAKKATTDANKAVTDAITALQDALTAAASVEHLMQSLKATEPQVTGSDDTEGVQRILNDSENGISTVLTSIYNEAEKKLKESTTDKEKAQAELNTATAESAKKQAELDSLNAALAAANTAVAQ